MSASCPQKSVDKIECLAYVDYEYLLLSRYFEARYYIIAGTEKNYLHLVGVHTNLDQETFYNKCIDRNLEEKDFDFIDAKGNDILTKILFLK